LVTTFYTTLKRPDTGRSRRRKRGRVIAPGLSQPGTIMANVPPAGASNGKPRAASRQLGALMMRDAGSRPGGAWARGVAATPQGWGGPLFTGQGRCLRRGRSPGQWGPSAAAVRGWLRKPPRPPSTRASRAGRTRGRQRGTTGHGSRAVAAPEPARSTGCGSTANGAETGSDCKGFIDSVLGLGRTGIRLWTGR
jgi:hypothetical protein